MSVKLVYHTSESASGGISPFDKAVVEIATDEELWVACPYLSLSYLERVIGLSKSWRLLTDVEEWLSSQNRAARNRIQEFIVQHQEQIHHIRDLHAKVVIAGEKALVGSVNLTEKGITGRTEVAVLFDQESQVEELRCWYADLWDQSGTVDIQELRTCIGGMPEKFSAGEGNTPGILITRANPIRASLQPIQRRNKYLPIDDPAFWLLVERVRFAPGREWIDRYFDLMKLLIEATGLPSGDPRIVTSIPKGNWFLPVSVNNRYVLAPHRQEDNFQVGIIYGPEFEAMMELAQKVVYHFRPLRGEHFVDTPVFLGFDTPGVILETAYVREGWIAAALLEVQRAKGSPYRAYHQPVVYEAAINIDYRRKVLDLAFLVE